MDDLELARLRGGMERIRHRQERHRTATRMLVPAGIAVAVVLLVVWKVVLPLVTVQEEADLPTDADSLTSACDFPGIAYTTAAAFEGPAPHPVKLPYAKDASQLTDLPSAWRPDDVRKVQLIACADFVEELRHQKECNYRPRILYGAPGLAYPVSMYEGTYKVTLYELRTHRKVAQTTLIGKDDECPSGIMVSRRTGPDRFHTRLAAPQYVEAFSGYVEK